MQARAREAAAIVTPVASIRHRQWLITTCLLLLGLPQGGRAAAFKLPQNWLGSLHGFALVNYSARPHFEGPPGGDEQEDRCGPAEKQ
jgi:hypothetical protein